MGDGLEERILVTFYEVVEGGGTIDYDTYDYDIRNPWEKSHGLYKTQEAAERKRQELIQKKVADGWELNKDGEPWSRYSEYYARVRTHEVERWQVTRDPKGNIHYNGRRIQ
jgi:hypothetical protein